MKNKFIKKLIPKSATDLIIPILVAAFNVLIILYPKDIIEASRAGLNLWWSIVMPSLLPFVIGTNILTGLGVVRMLGVLLSPITYKLFGVPGVGGFALVTGMTSGYPMGAKVTAALLKKKELSAREAQRLISFVNNSGPLFIIGSVGIGMFGSIRLGYYLLGIHYLSAIITGLVFRYYHYEKKITRREKRILSKALYEMQIERAKDGRSFGLIMSDAVKNAMETVTQIGGFIILFSVIVRVIEIAGIIDMLGNAVSLPAVTAGASGGIDRNIVKGFFIGIIEVTNGTKAIASSGFGKMQVIICSIIISFGGFSIHAQTLNFIAKTDIKTGVYLLSKLMHAAFAAITASLLYPVLTLLIETEQKAEAEAFFVFREGFFSRLSLSTIIFFLSLVFIIIISILSRAGRKKH